jgi:hypothetical protein
MKLQFIAQLFALYCLLGSCSNTKLEKCTLEQTNRYSLPLQKNTALANIEKIALNRIDDSLYISFLDNSTRAIYIYSFTDKKLIRSVDIQIKDFNILYSSYLIHNLDSIFLLDYRNSKLYLISSSGVLQKKIEIRSTNLLSDNRNNQGYFAPFPTDGLNSNGFYFLNNKVYISSSGNESVNYSSKCKDVFQIDLDNNTSNLVFQKPLVFSTGFWGNNFCHNIQIAFNPISNFFIVGYGIDHFVYATDFQTFNISHKLNSKSLTKIKPFSKEKPSLFRDLTDQEKNDIEQYDFLNGYYFGLYFDIYQNKYYRFANMPVRKKDYIRSMNTGVFEQKIAMVVADSNFNIIKDFELSGIHICPIFILNGKFYFIDRESYRNNSDSLYLSVYSIK